MAYSGQKSTALASLGGPAAPERLPAHPQTPGSRIFSGLIDTQFAQHFARGLKIMDVIVSVFAVVVALGCFIAIFLASRKDKNKEKGD
jgi:hypothetical protein